MDDELLARVRQLHARGLSTNAITRVLDTSRSGVAPLVRCQGAAEERVAGPSAIGFGRDGKPECVQGPYEDADRILRTLEAIVGRESFHFAVQVPMHVG